MFSLTNVDAEASRARSILEAQPVGFGFIITEEDLCKFYLYHFVVGNFGIFNETPILHLPHDNIPLVPRLWGGDLDYIFHRNQALYIATDGEFDIADRWAKVGPTYGPIFSDQQLHFYSTRYSFKTTLKESALFLDLLTVSPARNMTAVVGPAHNYNFRIMRIHNPHLYNYRGRDGRRVSFMHSGPLGLRPSPFVGPRGFPPNYHGFILFDPALQDLL